jgi:hypothetical protein
MAPEKAQESDTSIVVADADDNTPIVRASFAPVKSAAKELPPLSARVSRGSVLQEPTLRQVAPLVAILAGASFLNASPLVSSQAMKLIS